MQMQQIEIEPKYEYEGEELELFAHAVNWKKYWFQKLQPLIGRSVLEVGAGIGSTAKLFANSEIDRWLAIEPDINLVDYIKEDYKKSKYPSNYEIHNMTSSSMSSNEKYDTILYIDVLEHIQDDQSEINNIIKLLTPEGKIIILSPAHDYLYTPFDKAVGHFRRYDKNKLLRIMPKNMQLKTIYYLDCVGMLASLGNRLLLKSAHPTVAQIQFWDKCLVPISRVIDKLICHSLGKSIIAVFQYKNAS
jgi:2-polyprenyl-3-methyl-5-hydroxy-6-metoxy-1,4-benzoquinol methylase